MKRRESSGEEGEIKNNTFIGIVCKQCWAKRAFQIMARCREIVFFLVLSLSYSRVRTIKDYTSNQKVHGQPTIMCGTNVHIEKDRVLESSMTRAGGYAPVSVTHPAGYSRPIDPAGYASRRWPPKKLRRCFRSPLTGKSGGAEEDEEEEGREGKDAHDVPIFTKMFRKRVLRGNDKKKFRLPFYRTERLSWYHAIMSIVFFSKTKSNIRKENCEKASIAYISYISKNDELKIRL